MSAIDDDEEMPDEAVLEQRRQQYLHKSKNFFGRPCTKEELDAMYKSMHPEGPKFPDSDGSEVAFLLDNGNIDIFFSVNSPEMKAHGNRVYKPGDRDYEYYWKRHHFDNPQSKRHAISQKWDEENQDWIDLGESWL